MTRRFLCRIAFICACLFLCVMWAFYEYLTEPLNILTPMEWTIESGETISQFVKKLSDAKIIRYPFLLQWYAATRPAVIKAGHYELLPDMTLYQLYQRVTGGEVARYRFRFKEGWRFSQVFAALEADPRLTHDLRGKTEQEIREKLLLPELEGQFLPDTYFYFYGTKESSLLIQAHHALFLFLMVEWEKRDPRIPLTSPMQALVLASIVEREVFDRQEMAIVASIFYNRLAIGMPLQSDPTVSFAANKAFWMPITKADLANKNRYNTYKTLGLPPTPIALPSKKAIIAVFHPANVPYLYFLSTHEGRSIFSETYDAHRQAVKRYLRKEESS